jgi:uncharacterized Ntn-hydrolase superfamily protein
MKKHILKLTLGLLSLTTTTYAQDTFSIVAADSVTGEVGSAGASCVDLFNTGYTNDFLGELFPGVGAINTQAAYLASNQANARTRMNAGDSPSQIVSWLTANDAGGSPSTRQYGIVRLINGKAVTAGYTGTNCTDYKNHIAGPNYCVQGNILLGKKVLDSMEARFIREPGDLACKLMAALQGAKMVGADTRCAPNGTSTLFAFVKVSKPSDTFGKPYFIVSVKTHNGAKIEPIDTLQKIFNKAHSCSITGISDHRAHEDAFSIFPNPAANMLMIRITSPGSSKRNCVIRDVIGRVLFEGAVYGETSISLAGWKNGVYVMEISEGTTTHRKKFLKL